MRTALRYFDCIELKIERRETYRKCGNGANKILLYDISITNFY